MKSSPKRITSEELGKRLRRDQIKYQVDYDELLHTGWRDAAGQPTRRVRRELDAIADYLDGLKQLYRRWSRGDEPNAVIAGWSRLRIETDIDSRRLLLINRIPLPRLWRRDPTDAIVVDSGRRITVDR